MSSLLRTSGAGPVVVMAALVAAAAASACGRAATEPGKPPHARASLAAPPRAMTEAEQLAVLIARVTPEQRRAYEVRRRALWDRHERTRPAPRVLFEVPLEEETSECLDQAPECARSRALHYNREFWGLGPFAVGHDGVLWVEDGAIGRFVGFDHEGKIVQSFFAPESGSHDLVVLRDEIWIDAMRGGDEPLGLVRLTRSGVPLGRYGAHASRGIEHRSGGQVVSTDPLRIAQPGYEGGFMLGDVSFEGERIVFGPLQPIVVGGKRYALDCDRQGKRPATFVIGDRAVPAPGCLIPYWFGPGGDFIAGPPFYHFDASGEPIGLAAVPHHEDPTVYADGRHYDIGPDGKLYAYVLRKRSVRFVQVPFSR